MTTQLDDAMEKGNVCFLRFSAPSCPAFGNKRDKSLLGYKSGNFSRVRSKKRANLQSFSILRSLIMNFLYNAEKQNK